MVGNDQPGCPVSPVPNRIPAGCPPSACLRVEPKCPFTPPAHQRVRCLCLCSATKSRHTAGRRDEPFPIRDIQFNYPQIGVFGRTGRQVIRKLRWIIRVLLSGADPDSSLFEIRHLLKQAGVCASFSQDNQNCPPITFTFVQDCGKSAGSFYAADHTRHFKVSGQARGQAASFSIELDNRP